MENMTLHIRLVVTIDVSIDHGYYGIVKMCWKCLESTDTTH